MSKTFKATKTVKTTEDAPKKKKKGQAAGVVEGAVVRVSDDAVMAAELKKLVLKPTPVASDDDEYEDEVSSPVEVSLGAIIPEAVSKEIELTLVEEPKPETFEDGTGEEAVDTIPLEVPNDAKNLLIMPKPWCFRCSHLVSTTSAMSEKYLRAYTDCHYMSGNAACPAARNRLVRGLPVEQMAKDMANATRKGDMDADLTLRTKLAKFDPIMQALVNKRYLEILRSDS